MTMDIWPELKEKMEAVMNHNLPPSQHMNFSRVGGLFLNMEGLAKLPLSERRKKIEHEMLMVALAMRNGNSRETKNIDGWNPYIDIKDFTAGNWKFRVWQALNIISKIVWNVSRQWGHLLSKFHKGVRYFNGHRDLTLERVFPGEYKGNVRIV